MPIIVFILFALVLLILTSGVYTFCVACARRHEPRWLDEEDVRKTPYGKYYENIVLGDKFISEHASQEIQTISHDGLRLRGIWVPAENPKGTILLAHGYRSSKLVDFSMAFGLYHSMGMNILLPDQRAHGKSEGKYITFGVKESRDMQSWIDFHNKYFGEFPIILSGLSMGASTVLYLADENLPLNVKGIIADCGFTSPKEIIATVFRRVVHLPPAPSLWVCDLCARLFAGFSLTQKDTRLTLKNAKLPVLLVHGVADGFVPCEMTRQGYDICNGEKEILLVENADHGVSFLVDKDRYTKMVIAFLGKYIKENKNE